MSDLKINLQEILQDKNTNLLPENLKAGVTCLGVEGTAQTGIDTSDADATPEDITINKTAYVNGQKITGTLPLFPNTRTFTVDNAGVTDNTENSTLELTTINTLKQTLDSNLNMKFSAPYSDIVTAIGLTTDKLVQGNTILGVEGTFTSDGVKLFETVEEMEVDSTAQEGDLALVYKEDIQNMTANTQTQYITFPETVVLPEAITSGRYIMLQSVEGSNRYNIILNSGNFEFQGQYGSGRIRVQYSSEDGITYNRFMFTGDSSDLTNPVDLGTVVELDDTQGEWNDSFGYFMQIDKTIFNGLYKYDGVNYNIAANQYTLISSNQLLPDISAYGKNGNVTGDGSIETPDNTFADIPTQLYHNIQQKYNNMEPRVLTDEDKEIDDNIYIIPTKSDGTVLLDTSQVTNMNSMFNGCSNLTEVPTLNTSQATDMSYMFSSCSNLTKVSLLDTADVTNMYSMFYNCTSLTTIPQLDTSKVTSMGYMFYNCTSLTTIPQLDTSKVTDMNRMFQGCTSLTTIPLLDTSAVTGMTYMFDNCTSLTTIPQLDTSAVTNMYGMFYNCTSLTTIPQLDTSKVTSMTYMFDNCTSLTDDSLNNILAMLTNATAYTRTKTLKYIGLSKTQATTCTTLSNWAACEAAGWTTGY